MVETMIFVILDTKSSLLLVAPWVLRKELTEFRMEVLVSVMNLLKSVFGLAKTIRKNHLFLAGLNIRKETKYVSVILHTYD